MVKIDICDDESIWIDKVREIIGEKNLGDVDIELNCFEDSKRLIKKLVDKQEYSDIVLLDIDMPEINGFDVAELIKTHYPDVILIFFSSHEQFVFDSFRFQPFRFVRKSHAENELGLALSAAVQAISEKSNKSLILKSYDEICRIETKNIVYFEVDKRRCNVCINDGKVLSVRKGIKELFSEVNSEDFIMLHSGAAVNVKYIRNYSSLDVTMENGVRLMVSRSHMKNVKSAILRYWGDKL